MEDLMFTSPMHRDIGSSSMFGMYPTMAPMGMYGGMYGGSYVQGPGLTRDKFQLVHSKRHQGRNAAKKVILGTTAAVLSIILFKKLNVIKGVKSLDKLAKEAWITTKKVGKFIVDWVKYGFKKLGKLLKKIPSAPKH